jgi:RNA polymerase sigma-70 factor (ECF subfamily)
LKRLDGAGSKFDVEIEPFIARVVDLTMRNSKGQTKLEELNVEDLFLAYAACRREPKALSAFSERCDQELRAVVARMRFSESDFEDFRQQLWNKLFLGVDAAPMKVLDYRGTGQLRHWFRIVATRFLLDERRRTKRSESPAAQSDWELIAPEAISKDPEMEYIYKQYRFAFKSAFDLAMRALASEERNLLRLHHVLGKTTEEIAEVLGTHKATAARHIAKAREKLAMNTRQELKVQLGADSMEVESAMRLFDGNLTYSWSKYAV